MDLNHIHLPVFTIAELYRNSLVIPANTDNIPILSTEKIKPKSLGNNRKHILITVNDATNPFLAEKEMHLLTGILKACHLDLQDVAIINIHSLIGADYKEFSSYFNPELVFLFGTGPLEIGLPMDFPAFQLQTFNHVKYLFSPGLETIGSDRSLKSALWDSLKRIFNL